MVDYPRKGENVKKVFFLLVCLVGPAIIGFVGSRGVEYKLDESFRKAIAIKNPGDRYSDIRLRHVCASPKAREALGSVCIDIDMLVLMQRGALLVGVLSLLMVALISLGGKIAAKNRTALLTLFVPGLYITMGTTCLIVIINAALLFGTIWYVESILIERVHIGIMLGLAMGAIFSVLAMIGSSFRALKKATSFSLGKALFEKDAPELWEFVKNLATKVGAQPPKNIVVGLDPNFYVTEANVLCLDGVLTGRTLYLSLPLSRILAREELTAVVGHEFGHFIGYDTKFSSRFYPVYRGATGALFSLGFGAKSKKRNIGVFLASLPAIQILGYFLDTFSTIEREISRQREIEADKVGAALGGKKNLAVALVKIHAFTPNWAGMNDLIIKQLSEGLSVGNMSALFSQVVSEKANKDALKGLAEAHMIHPTDTHPPLVDRLSSLSMSMGHVEDDSLVVAPPDPAIRLIRHHEKIETDLSNVRQTNLIRSMRVQLSQKG